MISVFGDSGAVDLRRRRRRRRAGLGLRDLQGRRDPHQRPRRHRRRDHRHPDAPAARGERDLRPVRRPQPGHRARRRLRPVRRRRADQGRSRRPRPAPADARLRERRRRSASRWPRSAARSARTSRCRSGVVSATDRSIDSLTDFGDRRRASRPTPRSTPATPAARCSTPSGQVVGINQQIQTSSGGNEGVGFAVPIDLAKRAVDQLRENGHVSYAYAGVTTQPIYPQLAERLGIDADTGALVSKVDRRAARPTTPACRPATSTIRFQGQEVDRRRRRDHRGQRREDRRQRRTSRGSSPASTRATRSTLDIIRDGDAQQVDLTLGERPTSVAG